MWSLLVFNGEVLFGNSRLWFVGVGFLQPVAETLSQWISRCKVLNHLPFHLLGFHTFPRVMTSCSDVVPSASRQRPGISSSGLWERSKPFNYSREDDSFENTPSPFPSACAFVRQSLLYTDTRSKDVKCHCQACCRRVAAVSGRVLPCLTPRLGALGSRLPGPRADGSCECSPSAPVQSLSA